MEVIDYISISNIDCKVIAEQIRKNIYTPAITSKTSVFLCGANMKNPKTLRSRIAKLMKESHWYSSNYELIFPEDIFDELLYSSKAYDILTLENLLAESVDVVVLVPESPGSFTELGAFVNNEKLRPKVICVLDAKYKKAKSFINLGPIKLLKAQGENNVVYIEFEKLGTSSERSIFGSVIRDTYLERILSKVRIIKKATSKPDEKITLLQLDKFLLCAIYLLEPASKELLIELVKNAIEDEKFADNSTIAAIGILIKKRFIENTTSGYVLTYAGSNEFMNYKLKQRRDKQIYKTIAIDNLRLEILNLKYRNKKLKV